MEWCSAIFEISNIRVCAFSQKQAYHPSITAKRGVMKRGITVVCLNIWIRLMFQQHVHNLVFFVICRLMYRAFTHSVFDVGISSSGKKILGCIVVRADYGSV
jgi:hypothetical protein